MAGAVAEVPVPEMNGLLMGVWRSSKKTEEVHRGSYEVIEKAKGLRLADEPLMAAPGVPNPDDPEFALRMLTSAIHG